MLKTEHRIHPKINDCSISLCMIVKDEEKLLPQCLDGAKDQVDEIIVVDTGSNDKTVEIAEGFGAKVYHHPWENDFSKHRNQSISYASGDWIFIMDADEALKLADNRSLRDYVLKADRAGCDSLVVRVIDYLSRSKMMTCSDSVRIFKNNNKINYTGIVHNNLVGYKRSGLSPHQIIHYGYDLDPDSANKKFERTATLLKKQIAEDPNNAAAHMYLGCSFISIDLFDEALREAMIAVELVESQDLKNPIFTRAYHNAALGLILEEELDEAKAICLKAEKRFGDQIDILTTLTSISFQKKKWDKALDHGNRYLKAIADYKNFKNKESRLVIVNTYGDVWKIYGWMGTAKLNLGELEAAISFYQKAVNLSPDKEEICRHAGLALISAGHIDQATPLLEEACRLEKEDKNSMVVEALFKVGVIKNDQTMKQKALNDITGFNNPTTRWLSGMAEFAFTYDDMPSAATLFFEILKQDEDHIMARLQIAKILLEAGHIEAIVEHCNHLLRALGLARDITLSSLKDLAGLFAEIGLSLKSLGDQEASIFAEEISHGLLALRTTTK